MRNSIKRTSILILAVFILTTIFFSGIIDKRENYFAQASFWNIIRAWITINPLEVDISVPAEVEVDKVFKVKAKIINKGEEKIENIKSEIHLSEGLVLLKKKSVQKIGVIPGKKEKKISWAVKGTERGSYIIVVSASGELRGDLINAEDGTKIEVKENIPPGWKQRFDFFQRFFDFLRERLSY